MVEVHRDGKKGFRGEGKKNGKTEVLSVGCTPGEETKCRAKRDLFWRTNVQLRQDGRVRTKRDVMT